MYLFLHSISIYVPEYWQIMSTWKPPKLTMFQTILTKEMIGLKTMSVDTVLSWLIHNSYQIWEIPHTSKLRFIFKKICKLLNLRLTRSQKQVIYLKILKMISLTNTMQKHQMKLWCWEYFLFQMFKSLAFTTQLW